MRCDGGGRASGAGTMLGAMPEYTIVNLLEREDSASS